MFRSVFIEAIDRAGHVMGDIVDVLYSMRLPDDP